MDITLTVRTNSAEALREAFRVLAAANPDEAAVFASQVQDEARHLRVVRDSEAV